MRFPFDVTASRHPSRRSCVLARRGVVCSSQPLAAEAGLEMLRRGGNAVDAAIAAAAVLTVTEPTSNGLGGDAFALIWADGRLHGLNSSGRAPALADAETLRRMGGIPREGWPAVTVPGIPAAWAEASRRFGRLPFAELLEPAVYYAENGYPLAPVVSRLWEGEFERFSPLAAEGLFRPWFETFAPGGHAPRAGDTVRLPALAASLREIAETEAESFYRGRLAREMDAWSRKTGGWLRYEDLAAHSPEWVEPMSVDYRGYQVWELPPNGHGLVVLETLGILSGLPAPDGSPEGVHRAIEALKLAYADGKANIAEPADMRCGAGEFLREGYLASRRALIGPRALFPEPGSPDCGGTVYLCAADGEGNMVSWIQSNYQNFGSGVVVPGTGIALHNRGCNFSLDPASPNVLAPGKRPYHTIIPGFLSRAGRPIGPFGVMGAFMQPQGHVQALINMIDLGMNPQEALDAPRWQWYEGKSIGLEPGFDAGTAADLAARGHEISRGDPIDFGRGQIIWRSEDGALCAATEPRADGGIAAY